VTFVAFLQSVQSFWNALLLAHDILSLRSIAYHDYDGDDVDYDDDVQDGDDDAIKRESVDNVINN
jgi:hypothetical protein